MALQQRNTFAFTLNEVFNFLFDDEDYNDDDDFFDNFLTFFTNNVRRERIPRVRNLNFFEQVCGRFSAEEFRKHYRMKREVCLLVFSFPFSLN